MALQNKKNALGSLSFSAFSYRTFFVLVAFGSCWLLSCNGAFSGFKVGSTSAHVVPEEPQSVDCVMSEWSGTGACKSGKELYTRTINTFPSGTGKECEPELQKFAPSVPCTPVDCEMTSWSETSVCQNGQMFYTRQVKTPASNGGTPCETELQKLQASPTCRPTDCTLGEWTPTGVCLDGKEQFLRQVTAPATNGGTCTEELYKTEDSANCAKLTDEIKAFVSSTVSSTANITSLEMQLSVFQKYNFNDAQKIDKDFYYELSEFFYQEMEKPRDCQMTDWASTGECVYDMNSGDAFYMRERFTRDIKMPQRGTGEACEDMSKLVNSTDCTPEGNEKIKALEADSPNDTFVAVFWIFLGVMTALLLLVLIVFIRQHCVTKTRQAFYGGVG